MNKRNKKENAITLIALVVTIIVLLILAGVSISLVLGENGIITKTKYSKQVTLNAQVEEQVRLAVMAAKIEGKGNINFDTLNSELDKIGYTEEDVTTLPADVTINGVKVTIDENGITEIETEENEEIEDTVISIDDIIAEGIIEDLSWYRISAGDKDENRIYEKAEEEGVIKKYEKQQVAVSGDITYNNVIKAELTEPCRFKLEFYTLNSEQKPSAIGLSIYNYETNIFVEGKFTGWIDGVKPSMTKTGGENESHFCRLRSDIDKPITVILMARMAMLPNTPIEAQGQVVHFNIKVISETDYQRIANELGIEVE